jgi:HEAT repeat protein
MKGGPKAVEAIIQAIGQGTTHYKIEAIRMLARLGDPRAGLALAGLMKDEDDQVRQTTMEALEHLAGVLDEPTAAALLEHLGDDRIQERVTSLLGVIPTSIGPLSERLRDPDEAIRQRAAEILAQLLDPLMHSWMPWQTLISVISQRIPCANSVPSEIALNNSSTIYETWMSLN